MVERSFAGTPPYGLHPCLYSNVPTGLCWGYGEVTLLRSSERNGRFIQGFRYAPPLPVFYRPYGTCVCLVSQDILGIASG